jgi:hypothetical protein
MNYRCSATGSALISLVICSFTGCSGDYELAEVDGVLSIRGTPAHKMMIQFIPDIDHATKGPISVAETDEAGHFVLRTAGGGDSLQDGAVVGWHRVVLSDLRLAESATGRGVPRRLDSKYTLPSSTPLVQEVSPGKQTIKIQVP